MAVARPSAEHCLVAFLHRDDVLATFLGRESSSERGVVQGLFVKHHRKALDYFTAASSSVFFEPVQGGKIHRSAQQAARPLPRKLAKSRWQNDLHTVVYAVATVKTPTPIQIFRHASTIVEDSE